MAQKEGATVAVGGDNDTSSAVAIIGRQYSDHPQHQPLVAALSTKKYATLTVKKEVLLLFLPSKLGDIRNIMKYWRDPDLFNHFFWHLLDHLRRNSKNDSQIKQKFTTIFVAETLADLYVLDQWNNELPDDRRPSRSQNNPSAMVKAFASVSDLVGPIMKKYLDDQAKTRQKKAKVNRQETGTRVQDTVPFNLAKLDPECCPSCTHRYCMMVTSNEEVQAKQDQDDAEFEGRMVIYNRLSAAEKKKKSKPPNFG